MMIIFKYIIIILILLLPSMLMGATIIGYDTKGGTDGSNDTGKIIMLQSTDDNVPSDSATIDSIHAWVYLKCTRFSAPYWSFKLGVYDASDSTLVCSTATYSTSLGDYLSGLHIQVATTPETDLPCTCSTSKEYYVGFVNTHICDPTMGDPELSYYYDSDESDPYDYVYSVANLTLLDPFTGFAKQVGRKYTAWATGTVISSGSATPQVIMITGD